MNGIGIHQSLDPLDLEVTPGRRVRDLATIGECIEAVMLLDMDRERIMAQISRAEAEPDSVEPGWRTRAQSAMRWRNRTKAAVKARQQKLTPTADQKRGVLIKTIRSEIGEREFQRIFAKAKEMHPEVDWEAA